VTKVMTSERVAAELTKFNSRKGRLLKILHNGYETGPKHAPFDKDKSWINLTDFARFYLGQEKFDKKLAIERVPRARRLSDLAEQLDHAYDLVGHGIFSDLGSDLFTAWSEHIKFSEASSFVEFQRSKELSLVEFRRSLVALAELSSAAHKAADYERRNPGRPKGPSVLPSSDAILGLASVYRRCTGSKPGAGTGIFADFSKECLDALGKPGIIKGSLVNAIKSARKNARVFADRNGVPSPFD